MRKTCGHWLHLALRAPSGVMAILPECTVFEPSLGEGTTLDVDDMDNCSHATPNGPMCSRRCVTRRRATGL